MRPTSLALLIAICWPAQAWSKPEPFFEDSALHAVQFVDREEGWAVGDEGVVWHTIDGGRSWDRQPTGVRASLRALHFLNPYTGWIVGREELPHSSGSAGVLLFTQDGGLTWQAASRFALPGLQGVRFLDAKNGYVVGDGTDQFSTGIFVTRDSGQSWKPLPGPRCPGWMALDLTSEKAAVVAGPWNRLATIRDGTLAAADVDVLGGRNLRAIRLISNRAVAVGQGGQVLLSDSAGVRWGFADLPVPSEVRACWDFHALSCVNKHIWIAGRPGSKILHSPDGGTTWDILNTTQPLPLNGLFFVDEQRGWAVGELGTILKTEDGGKNWRIQQRGGQRSAALFIHARPNAIPVDTIALLGAQEGFLTVGIRILCPDSGSAPLARAADCHRLPLALRLAGAASGEMLWQFPLPLHLARSDSRSILAYWDTLHADRSAEQLLRQIVLALRMWRPSMVITDHPDSKVSGYPVEEMLAEAVKEAFGKSGDSQVFPEHVQFLGLEPWKPMKLYSNWDGKSGSHVAVDLNEPRMALNSTLREFAIPSQSLLQENPLMLPGQRYFRLLDSRLPGGTRSNDLMDGIDLASPGTARRKIKVVQDQEAVGKAIRARRNWQVLAENSADDPIKAANLLAHLGPALKSMPDDQGAAAAFALANQYARLGQWQNAREIFLMMVERFPAHSLTLDAYRWLIRHNTSSEARRRHDLGQFLIMGESSIHHQAFDPVHRPKDMGQKVGGTFPGGVDTTQVKNQALAVFRNRAETGRWYEGSLDLGKRLEALGPLWADDPSIQFCLQSARRRLGDYTTALEWFRGFTKRHSTGPYREAAAAELWLANRSGKPPKVAFPCRPTSDRPFLDANFDDPCWQDLKPFPIVNAVGNTARDYPTRAWIAYDLEYLYLALQCGHPENCYVPPVAVRPRDADLRPYDRVSFIVDLDRDYSTFFHLQVDQRGCLAEDCWGDRSWDPRWFVAFQSDKTGWKMEAAIPLAEFTGDPLTSGQAWAFNVVRTLPGMGVQAWSLPADAQVRTDGLGLLLFAQDNSSKPAPSTSVPQEKKK